MPWPLRSCGKPTTAASATFVCADERALDLGRAEPVARDVDHVVDAARDPVVAVLVAARAVAREVLAGELLEIRVDEALMIAVDRAHLARPAVEQHEVAGATPSRILPCSSTIAGLTPKNGSVAEPGFSFVAPGSGVISMPPVSVCHHVSTIGQRPSPTTW